ncbi:MAG TPA: dodecin family protein [Thermoanaerobaculia bacterium]|nr:dodecin family protein [Thermoanaerobaculia bacterium]
MPAAKKRSQRKSTQRPRSGAGRKDRARARTSPRSGGSSSPDYKVYKRITVTATSPDGYSDAVRVGIAKARETMRCLSWWQVLDQRGRIDPESCEIDEYQVTLAIHFEVE